MSTLVRARQACGDEYVGACCSPLAVFSPRVLAGREVGKRGFCIISASLKDCCHKFAFRFVAMRVLPAVLRRSRTSQLFIN